MRTVQGGHVKMPSQPKRLCEAADQPYQRQNSSTRTMSTSARTCSQHVHAAAPCRTHSSEHALLPWPAARSPDRRSGFSPGYTQHEPVVLVRSPPTHHRRSFLESHQPAMSGCGMPRQFHSFSTFFAAALTASAAFCRSSGWCSAVT